MRTTDHRSRRETLTRRRRAPSKRAVVVPAQFLDLFSAKDFDHLVNAAFRLLHATVSCDCVSVLYPGVGTRMLLERDSRGRRYDAAFTQRNAELTPAVRLAMASPGIKLLPTRTGLCLSDDELRRTDYYREVMAVQEWRHAVALCFWNDPPASFPVLVFSVKRQEGRADFSDDDLDALEMIHRNVHVLVSFDSQRTDFAGAPAGWEKGGDYPQVWSQMIGKGRTFYTAIGHREDLWRSDPIYRQFMVGAIRWVLKLEN